MFRVGSATQANLLPELSGRRLGVSPTASTARDLGSLRTKLRSFAWRFQPKPTSEIAVLRTIAPEAYDLKGLVSEATRANAPPLHFLNYTHYESRRFLICEGRNVLITRHAKGVAAPGHGFIDEFNVGGAGGIPGGLLEHDLYNQAGEWRAKDEDIERIRGCSIPLCHYGIGTFGHFMLDALLQVFLFREALSSGRAHLLHWPLPGEWMIPLLDACGVPAAARRRTDHPVVLMEYAGLSSALAGHGVYFPSSLSLEFFDWIRTVFDAPRSNGRRRLYIQRSGSFGRVVENATPVEILAERYGFEVVCPETLAVADQIRLFAEAGMVLSPWGSGLTLAPLMSGPRCVLELLPDSVTDAWFIRQAAVHELDYHPLVQPSDASGNIQVDLVQLEATLSALAA